MDFRMPFSDILQHSLTFSEILRFSLKFSEMLRFSSQKQVKTQKKHQKLPFLMLKPPFFLVYLVSFSISYSIS